MSILDLFLDGYNFNRQTELIALDSIYVSTGYKIPLAKIKFGDVKILITRPDLEGYPNTYLEAKVDSNFDYRLANAGFMYFRLGLDELTATDPNTKVIPPHYPFNTSDVLPQINTILQTELTLHDVLELSYSGDTENFVLIANPDSFFWVGSRTLPSQSNAIGPLITTTDLNGFVAVTSAP